MIEIELNGEKREIPAGLTVRDLMHHLDLKPEQVAVELNREILKRGTWREHPVKEGDVIEVVHFVGGGE